MQGIYLHIPFCKQKCHYCNFYSVASQKYRAVFVDALLREIALRRDYLVDKRINTVYFGGGTPSMLRMDEINRIIKALENAFDLEDTAEITFESNPDDLSIEYLNNLKNNTGINRLSIGVQSFFDDDLTYLHRVHKGDSARYSIERALSAGFKNISIDLIYGIPTLTEEKWRKNLSIFFDYGLPHLSSYALTVEAKTALQILIRKNRLAEVKEEPTIRQFEILLKATKDRDFIHYEISNFAQKGFYSKHNSIYWLGGHYLGLGPSAHSFNGFTRQWNVSNLKQYTEANTIAQIVKEKEVLSEKERFNEYVMTSLRTVWGVDTEHIENIFGRKLKEKLEKECIPFEKEGKITKNKGIYTLTDFGKLFADGIAAALFRD